MPLGDEFGDFGWQQPLLLRVPGPESLRHTFLIVQISQTFTKNRSLSTRSRRWNTVARRGCFLPLTAVANATDRERTGRPGGTRTYNLDTLLVLLCYKLFDWPPGASPGVVGKPDTSR
jgi:hypothetical protein